MKIGVLTYHKERSQGATFQAYATYRALRELGCDVEVIDLERKTFAHSALQRAIVKPYFFLFEHRQDLFRKEFYPPYSRHYANLEELQAKPPIIDAACVGSDQTWNGKIAMPENALAYFLDFGPKGMYRFSYASSFGYPKWMIDDEEKTKRIGELMKSYVGLSVRETTGAQIIKDKFGLDATVVCDPTILHTNYDEFTQGLKQQNEMVCYFLFNYSDNLVKANHEISDFLKIPARWVGRPYFVRGFKNSYFPDIVTWYRRIASAQFVATDSFHGTVAALICKKPFVVLYRDYGLSSRIVDLLTQVGLEDRIYFNYEAFAASNSWKQPINYDEVGRKLNAYRERSWAYLRGVIEKIAQEKK